ncbi:GIY-YIG nuclease family protein [Mycetocola zhujimingii]|nr:GIY-YIG nuclease family protein [Mycetocola zhujimingii]
MPLSSAECKTYRIYALVDPSTNLAYYFGQTANTLFLRWRDHLRKPGDTKKGDWVRELRADEREPHIVLLEEFSGYRPHAYERESYWIKRLRSEGTCF